MRDDVKGARLLERGEEDLVCPGLEFGVLKNELAARRDRKIGEEYVAREHYGLSAMPQLNVAQLVYLTAEEGDEGVLLNARLDKRGVRDLEPVAVGRESGNVRKDAIDIPGLSVLYPRMGTVGGWDL
jgi:hypothetical protein